MIIRCVDKIEIWETRDRELEEVTNNHLKEMEDNKLEEEHNTCIEPVDYNASQESIYFGTKPGMKTSENGNDKDAENCSEDNPRRCGRLVDIQNA